MAFARLDRLLTLGQSDSIPDRELRHLRVTNALALLGVVLSATALPLDLLHSPMEVVISDVVGVAAFSACWALNARGHRDAARVLLLLAGNAVILQGVHAIGAEDELRTMFFPLALLPFLVFGTSERGWLALFVALPITAYFVLGVVEHPAPSMAREIYLVYAPVLAFTMIVAASVVFAYVERSAEDKLLRARARAAQGARLVALGEMSSGIAHEIRNPLAAIHLAATQLVERPDDPVVVAQLGERIQRIVMRASRITEALRSFARDAAHDPCEPAAVERIISDALELCGKRFVDHGIALTVAPVPPGLAVECRRMQLAQVLVNLLGNAYDAAAAGPGTERWVRIEVGVERGELELAVVDSGPGVPAAVRQRIFEPFFTTKAPERGTGIGLSLSRDLVEAHHGTLELDAAAPHTRFVIRLPLTQPRG